jgi:hypothetical protein
MIAWGFASHPVKSDRKTALVAEADFQCNFLDPKIGFLKIVAKGKRDLLVPTADGVREPQNRRVQIVFDGGPTS